MKPAKITLFKKYLLTPLGVLFVSCQPLNSSGDSSIISDKSSNVPGESITTESKDSNQLSSETNFGTSDENNPSHNENPNTSIPNSSEEETTSSEETRTPGIYLKRTRIGVAKDKTITIEHEVVPKSLGEVTWELIPNPKYSLENQAVTVTPSGMVTGNYFNGLNELQIKGTLLQFEVYVTVMVFFDYDVEVDTFYPAHELTEALGRGNRYKNGTTIYAGINTYRHTHYYSYDLKAGMTFNVMGLTRYNYDRPKFYYEFGRAINNTFYVLEMPFISDDGNAMLLGHDVLEDGEYMVRVKPHIEINTNSDGFSYIMYTFWF